MNNQHTLMKFDPATGEERPYPSHAEQWRLWHGRTTAWLIDPWTGNRRNAVCVGSDPYGHLILPPGEVLQAVRDTSISSVVVASGGVLTAKEIKDVILSNTHPDDIAYAVFITEDEVDVTANQILMKLSDNMCLGK